MRIVDTIKEVNKTLQASNAARKETENARNEALTIAAAIIGEIGLTVGQEVIAASFEDKKTAPTPAILVDPQHREKVASRLNGQLKEVIEHEHGIFFLLHRPQIRQ